MGDDDDDGLLDGWESGDVGREEDTFDEMLGSSRTRRLAGGGSGNASKLESSSSPFSSSSKQSKGGESRICDTSLQNPTLRESDVPSIGVGSLQELTSSAHLSSELSKHIRYENRLVAQLEKVRQDCALSKVNLEQPCARVAMSKLTLDFPNR